MTLVQEIFPPGTRINLNKNWTVWNSRHDGRPPSGRLLLSTLPWSHLPFITFTKPYDPFLGTISTEKLSSGLQEEGSCVCENVGVHNLMCWTLTRPPLKSVPRAWSSCEAIHNSSMSSSSSSSPHPTSFWHCRWRHSDMCHGVIPFVRTLNSERITCPKMLLVAVMSYVVL